MELEITMDHTIARRAWRVEDVLHGTILRVSFHGPQTAVLVSGDRVDRDAVLALVDPFGQGDIEVREYPPPPALGWVSHAA